MVDRVSRDKLAVGLRRLASGQMTIGEYESLTDLPFDDPAVFELWLFGWCHYSDFWRDSTRLRGERALSREERRCIAQAVLFLKTDQEYVHGNVMAKGTVDLDSPWAVPVMLISLFGILVLGIFWLTPWWHALTPWQYYATTAFCVLIFVSGTYEFTRNLIRQFSAQPPPPDAILPWGSIWPFADTQTFGAAIRHPVFLACPRRSRAVE
jgi:hypothetical protein